MFERFTERARQVVVLAQEEARTLKHNYIGTEHILLGLLREEEGLAARVLESLDITVERVRSQVVRIVGSGEEVSIILGTLVGALTLTGSLVAFAKLQGLISGRPIVFANQQLYNAAIFAAIVILSVLILVLGDGATDKSLMIVLFLLSLAIGVTVVLPIGGADMPVVI